MFVDLWKEESVQSLGAKSLSGPVQEITEDGASLSAELR